jgi:hypothetical protein
MPSASRRPYFLRQLLVMGSACLLVLPGELAVATAALSSPVARAETTAASRDRDAQAWWLLLGIAPLGLALPWLYRWHRATRGPADSGKRLRQASAANFNSAPAADLAAPDLGTPKAVTTGRSVPQASPEVVKDAPGKAVSPAQTNHSAQPASPDQTIHQSPDVEPPQPVSTHSAISVPQPGPEPQAFQQPGHSLDQPLAVQPASRPEGGTTRLAKIDIVEALATDLHSSDSAKRRQAIWELGQRGDSRAIQPLVDLLVDADSQQRSLILAALAEISTRALKPMQRALMLSLQDDSPDVRKNAIRDITRIYDLMAQASQLLQYAASDSDEEVQETARWALGQLGRVRSAELGTQANQPSLQPPE